MCKLKKKLNRYIYRKDNYLYLGYDLINYLLINGGGLILMDL